ncbi:hypothetical protein ABIA60_003995 [Pseudomonas frederiksbergensis]
MSTSISIGTRLHEWQLRVVFCPSQQAEIGHKRPVIKGPKMSRGEYLVTSIGPVLASKASGFNHLLAGGNRKQFFAQIGILSWNEIFGAFIAGKCFENVIDNFFCLVRSKDTSVYQVKKSIGYLVQTNAVFFSRNPKQCSHFPIFII